MKTFVKSDRVCWMMRAMGATVTLQKKKGSQDTCGPHCGEECQNVKMPRCHKIRIVNEETFEMTQWRKGK